jgi:hypothetical protein
VSNEWLKGEWRSTSATGGEKGVKPERYDLIPVSSLRELALVYGYGANKYSDRNWEKGYEYSKSYAALQRHLNQFWSGQNNDEESGLPHLAHAMFHIMALLQFVEHFPDFDDRSKL